MSSYLFRMEQSIPQGVIQLIRVIVNIVLINATVIQVVHLGVVGIIVYVQVAG